MRAIINLAVGLSMLGLSVEVSAAETVNYTYDAKGRLIKIVHSGSVNSGVTVDYVHDTADNRTNVKTTGSTN